MNPSDILPKAPLPRALIGFSAAFLSTLTFHEIGFLLVNLTGLGTFTLFNMRPTVPLGVPLLISLSFWGGLWGILYVFIVERFPRTVHPWVAGFLFAILLPTLFGWTIVATIKGMPIFLGFDVLRLILITFINGLWGVGLPILCILLARTGLFKAA